MKKGDSVGYFVDDPKLHVILSRGHFLYGRIDYITHRQNMMVVWTLWRRRRGTTVRKFKKKSYLKPWEKVSPPRYLLAVEGRIVSITPPEGERT